MKVTLSLLVLCVLLGLCLAYPFPDPEAEAVAVADPHRKRYGGSGRYDGGGYTGYAYGLRGPVSGYRIGNGYGTPLGHVYMGKGQQLGQFRSTQWPDVSEAIELCLSPIMIEDPYNDLFMFLFSFLFHCSTNLRTE
ncbi:uncharacterized protein [Macrobrachium rosenbergii]|uniref:uncharacterized protein n=1 Tax=Macrobrachium rosenbergii TaxID=79674 RepID=UPI0034D5A20D